MEAVGGLDKGSVNRSGSIVEAGVEGGSTIMRKRRSLGVTDKKDRERVREGTELCNWGTMLQEVMYSSERASPRRVGRAYEACGGWGSEGRGKRRKSGMHALALDEEGCPAG